MYPSLASLSPYFQNTPRSYHSFFLILRCPSPFTVRHLVRASVRAPPAPVQLNSLQLLPGPSGAPHPRVAGKSLPVTEKMSYRPVPNQTQVNRVAPAQTHAVQPSSVPIPMRHNSLLRFTGTTVYADSHLHGLGTSFPIIAIAIIGILATALLLVSYYIFVIKCCLSWHRIDFLRRLSFSRRREATFVVYTPATEPRGLEEAVIRLIPVIQFKKEENREESGERRLHLQKTKNTVS